MAAAAGGLYLWGHFTHNDHKRETGFLAGEAAVNAMAASYALKYAFGRERPLQDHYQGQLLEGWRFVSVRACGGGMGDCKRDRARIPQPVREASELRNGGGNRRGAHRCQATFSFGRAYRKHDRMVCGEEVYRRHHDPEVGGGDWETYAESSDESPARQAARTGSPYVELDSWIYPAIERLAALGYIRMAFLGSVRGRASNARIWSRRRATAWHSQAKGNREKRPDFITH